MRIDKIEIENFKLFEKQEFHFQPGFNLLVGENGSGKSSVLNAVAVALGGWISAFNNDKNNNRPIEDNEFREISIDNRFDKTINVVINATGSASIIDRYSEQKSGMVKFDRFRLLDSPDTISTATIKYGNYPAWYNLDYHKAYTDILNYIQLGNKFNLPLIAFYQCDRLWSVSDSANEEAVARKQFSRFDAYKDCFHTGVTQQVIAEWLLKYELATIQQKKQSIELQSIRNAAKFAVENCTGIRYDINQGRIIVEFDVKEVPFEHLSDGQRTIIAMFCDIARRAALLNPHLGDQVNAETPGVVLIDELDLHLHPRWQRTIIENLRTAFPKIQFICTTHSPFLVQSLRSGEELIMLDGQPLAEYANQGIEDIARNMGVERPEVGVRYEAEKEAAKAYLELLEIAAISPEEKQAEYQERLASLIAPFADNAAYQAFLELKYAAKLGAKHETC